MHQIKITARLNEGVDAEGVGFPRSVEITGAGFLAPSAIADIAQEVIDSLSGDYSRDYVAMRPDAEFVTDHMVVPVVKVRARG